MNEMIPMIGVIPMIQILRPTSPDLLIGV